MTGLGLVEMDGESESVCRWDHSYNLERVVSVMSSTRFARLTGKRPVNQFFDRRVDFR